MNRTTAPGSVGGFYVDDDPGTSTQGTLIVAADKNMTQEEIANAVEGMGLTLNAGADDQLLTGLRAASNTINADKLDGQHGSYYQDAANINAGIIADARMPNLTGDVTTTEGAVATTITNGAVTDAKLRNSGALSVIGRSANSAGAPADISAANDNEVLRRSGTDLAFGTIATGGITNSAVTNAKMANMAQDRIKGRVTASTGAPEDLTPDNVKTILDAGTSTTVVSNFNANLCNGVKFTCDAINTTGGARTQTIASMTVNEVKILAMDLRNTSGGTVTIAVALPAGGTYIYQTTTGNEPTGGPRTGVSMANAWSSGPVAGGATLVSFSVGNGSCLSCYGTIVRVT